MKVRAEHPRREVVRIEAGPAGGGGARRTPGPLIDGKVQTVGAKPIARTAIRIRSRSLCRTPGELRLAGMFARVDIIAGSGERRADGDPTESLVDKKAVPAVFVAKAASRVSGPSRSGLGRRTTCEVLGGLHRRRARGLLRAEGLKDGAPCDTLKRTT